MRHGARNVQRPTRNEISELLKLFNEGNYSAAVTAATAMACRYPSDGFAFKVLGPSLHYLGKSEEAVKSMEVAVKRSPNDVEAHANLGGLLNELERYDEAEPVLRKALELNPQSSQVLNNLSVTLLAQRRPEEAEVVSRREGYKGHPRLKKHQRLNFHAVITYAA